jgi:hypothetical protein
MMSGSVTFPETTVTPKPREREQTQTRRIPRLTREMTLGACPIR